MLTIMPWSSPGVRKVRRTTSTARWHGHAHADIINAVDRRWLAVHRGAPPRVVVVRGHEHFAAARNDLVRLLVRDSSTWCDRCG